MYGRGGGGGFGGLVSWEGSAVRRLLGWGWHEGTGRRCSSPGYIQVKPPGGECLLVRSVAERLVKSIN